MEKRLGHVSNESCRCWLGTGVMQASEDALESLPERQAWCGNHDAILLIVGPD